MMTRAAAYLSALLTCFCTSHAYAGAWTEPEGHALVATSATYYTTAHFFDNEGNLQPQSRFRKLGINAYGEYGITDGITVGTNLFLDSVDQADKSNLTLSNTELFLRGRVYHDDTRVISLQPLIKLPTASQHDRQPLGGSQSTDAELAVMYGQNINILRNNDFLDSLVAIRYRSDNLAPQYRAEARLGMHLTDRLLVIPAIYITQSISPEVSPFVQSGDLDYDLAKAELNLLYTLQNNDYVQVSAFDHFAGALAGSGGGVSIGYGMRF